MTRPVNHTTAFVSYDKASETDTNSVSSQSSAADTNSVSYHRAVHQPTLRHYDRGSANSQPALRLNQAADKILL